MLLGRKQKYVQNYLIKTLWNYSKVYLPVGFSWNMFSFLGLRLCLKLSVCAAG